MNELATKMRPPNDKPSVVGEGHSAVLNYITIERVMTWRYVKARLPTFPVLQQAWCYGTVGVVD
jgi:hypothetical protein